MKKILALLLAVMMLFTVTAVAEEAAATALVTHIGNIAIEATRGDETKNVNLEGFDAFLSVDTADGLALVGQLFNGDESLAQVVLKLVDNQIVVGIDGMDKAFAVDVPQLEGQDTTGLDEIIRAELPAILKSKLPMINLPSLTKIDIAPFAAFIGGVTEGDTTTFALPAEMVDMLLDQVIAAAKEGTKAIPGADEIIGMVEQMREFGMSFTVDGTITDSPELQTTVVNLGLVMDGEASDSPAVVLTMTSAQDALGLTLEAGMEEEKSTIAALNTQTDGQGGAIVSLTLMGIQFQVDIYQEDGLQKATLTMGNGGAAAVAGSLVYGMDGDTDMCALSLTAGEDNFAMDIRSNTVDETSDAGTFEFSAVTPSQSTRVTADVEDFLGSVDLGGYVLPETVVSYEELKSEENTAALNEALAPLYAYFNPYADALTFEAPEDAPEEPAA